MVRNAWVDNLIRPLIIVAMIFCLALSLVNLVRLFVPTWSGLTLIGGMTLAAVEGSYAQRLISWRKLRGGDRLGFRLGEWAMLIVALKLISFADFSRDGLWVELKLIYLTPGSFLSLPFITLLVLSFLAWSAAGSTLADFERLYEPVELRDRFDPPLDSLASRFFWGGGILIVVAGLTRVGLSQILDLDRPPVGGIILNVLGYFLLGLILLSQTRLTTLLVRWQSQEVQVSGDLVRHWLRYGMIFLIVVAAFSFLLPTSYSLGLLDSVAAAVSLLAQLIVLFWFLVILPFIWLMSLLPSSASPVGQVSARQPPPPLVNAGAAQVGGWEAIRSLIFWVLVLGIGIYLIRTYLQDHPGLLATLKRISLLRFLADVLIDLWRWLGEGVLGLVERLPRSVRIQSQGWSGSTRGWRWPRLAALSPRERILYYYLSILQRAGRQGLSRRKSQTPYEFEPELSQAVPDFAPDINFLTEAFVQARYSRRSFENVQSNLVKASWQRVRAALRHAGRTRPE
jgi:hypothetical protein